MSYQNIFYNRKTKVIHLWDDNGYKHFKYTPYAYIKHSAGNLTTIDGVKVKKVTSWNENDQIYESDINPEVRVLIDNYTDTDEPSKKNKIGIIDIEVDSTEHYPEIDNPVNEITAIAYYLKSQDRYYCFITDKSKRIAKQVKGNTYIIPSENEDDMLHNFITLYTAYAASIITGWNIDFFDIPYLYERLKYLYGDECNLLSPIGFVEKNKHTGIYEIAGVTCYDYLALFKKFALNEEPSYTLDAISKKVLGKGKIVYSGSLDDLYKNDPELFIEYNITDAVLVKEIDDKLGYIDIARSICHKGHVPYNCIWHSSRYLDGAILTVLKQLGIVAPNRPAIEEELPSEDDDDDETDSGGKFEGAYVKPPVPGRYRDLIALDATSLYPMCIITCNISPETLIGKLACWPDINMMAKPKNRFKANEKLVFQFHSNGKLQLFKDIAEFTAFLDEHKYCVAGNGAVYRTDIKGLIPSILERWFEERVEFKNLMVKYAKEGDVEKEKYFDTRQYVTKILLNSMYGVLGLRVFRFHNLDNAEAVTITGQDSLRFADLMGKQYLVKNYGGNPETDYCMYSDTDSTYFVLSEFIDKDKDLVTQLRRFAGELSNHINSNIVLLTDKHIRSKNNRLFFKEESAIKSGFWLAKKRYTYHKIHDLESDKPVDKIITKGLDVVRSNFPPLFRKFMGEILDDILKFVDKDIIDNKIIEFRESIPTRDLIDIAKPTSAKKLDTFKPDKLQFKKGTPAHIKAALVYNYLLKDYNLDKIHPPIKTGSKIKWVYVRDNKYNVDAIAFVGYDDPPAIIDYITSIVDYEKVFESNLQNKIQNFYSALSWGLLPTKANRLAESFFDFN